MALRIEAEGFRASTPLHRRDTFGGHPYEISLAGFFQSDRAVMVHSERVADASGASNYDALPAAAWPSTAFRMRRTCVALSADDIAGEHDLEWLRANGFDPAAEIVLEQVYLTDAAHNNEAVISLIVRDVDCEDPAGVEAALQALRADISVTQN